MALEIITCCGYERQRGLRQYHVDYLAQAMRAGQFALSTIKLTKLRDEWYLTNGQHRLYAIVACGISQALNVLFEEVSDEQALSACYYREDSGLKRQFHEGATASEIAEATGWTGSSLQALAGACRLIDDKFSVAASKRLTYEGRSPDARKNAILSWKKEAILFRHAISGADIKMRQKLTNSAVVGVALVSLIADEKRAQRFWSEVSGNDGLHRNSPQWRLVQILLTEPLRKYGPCAYSRFVAACWNAYYEGKETFRFSPQAPTEPMLIRGSSVFVGKDEEE
jgi:hypothetical protein